MFMVLDFQKSIHFLSYLPRGITSQPRPTLVPLRLSRYTGNAPGPLSLLLVNFFRCHHFLIFTMARCIPRRGVLGFAVLACGALFLFSSYRLPAAEEQIDEDHFSHDEKVVAEPPQVAWIMSYGGLVSSIPTDGFCVTACSPTLTFSYY